MVEGFDVRARQAVIQSEAREGKLAKRVLGENREARAVLHVILDILRIDAHGLLKQDGFLAGLIEIIARGKKRETGGDGPVKEIRLGKTKHERARQASKLRGECERLAKAEEVVGLISEAHETAGQAADAALQANGLLAFFLELERDVDRSGLVVALDFGGLVRFDFVEIIELVEAQDAQFPKALVEELTFINHQIAADDFVARGGVSAEIDAAHVILFLLVET